MSRVSVLQPEFVEFVPKTLQNGVLYISRKYKTASHLCCCGCGSKVVTPLNPSGWELATRGAVVSLNPSIGNWSLPCKSHYWVQDSQIKWARQWSQNQIDAGRRNDHEAQQAYFDSPRGLWQRFLRWLKG